MNNGRNTYLVSKVLKGFVLASILTSAAAQLASTFDAIVLAQFEGAEAVSALSLVLPVTTFISCLGLLLGFGANALSARAVGHNNPNQASAVFSTAVWSILILGVLFSLLVYAAIPYIMRIITDEPDLRALPTEYLSVYSLGSWLEMLSYALCLFVATDGHPRRVTMSVVAGVLTNIAVDVLAVGWFDWGIRGVALGSVAQFAVNVLLLGSYLHHPSCTYRLVWPGTRLLRLFTENIKEGAAVTISNILMALTVLLINNIIFHAQADRGLFFWSVCLQMLMLAVVFINGVMEALFAIGGVMVGEHDLQGFSLLSRRALIVVSVLVSLIVVLMWIPNAVGIMFGIEEPHELASINSVIRIFSLLLVPFALTITLMAVYQVLERILLSVVIAVGQLSVLVLSVWLMALVAPDSVWYAFPLSSLAFLLFQVCYTFIISRRQHKSVSALTLIPYNEGGRSFNGSVPYNPAEVSTVLNKIVAFLNETGVDSHTAFNLNLCLEELMTNIANHSRGRVVHHSFDVHIFVKDQHVRVTLKDAGRPFDPISAGRAADNNLVDGDMPNLGLRIAANILTDISYKYMYGLNVISIKV